MAEQKYVVKMNVDENVVPEILELDPGKVLRDLYLLRFMKHMPTSTFMIDDIMISGVSYFLKLLVPGNVKVLAEISNTDHELTATIYGMRELNLDGEKTVFSRSFPL